MSKEASIDTNDLEVQFKPESGKAVIEGRTAVPFQSLVALILQRKVSGLLKTWGKRSVIVESELLTSLASAPQDSQENRSNMILVSIIAGVLIGVAGFAAIQAGLMLGGMPLTLKDLGVVIGSIALLILLLVLMMKAQRKPKGEKLVETIESVAGFLSSKK